MLSSTEQEARVADLPQWQLQPNEEGVMQLHRNICCKNFLKGMEIVNAAANMAESRNHHPGRCSLRVQYRSCVAQASFISQIYI
jgi:pterin-4a-carbinolamine dehydratase